METFFVAHGGTGRAVPAHPGLSLAQSLFLAGGFAGRPLCSGAGRCGLCQVRFQDKAPPPLAEDQAVIAPERLRQGYRLSCIRGPVAASTVELALDAPPDAPRPAARTFPAVDPEAVLGLDLGTTAVKWRLDRRGETLAQGGGFNPQLGGGMDVMSRLALARHPQGAARLRQVVADCVRDVLAGLPVSPGRMCLAGNPAMIVLALGLDASGLAAAPYALAYRGGEAALLAGDLPEAYVAPLWAPFVGGDVSAGLAALAHSDYPPRSPWLLADLGTNGEFALATPGGEVHVASVPMGPALEGVGMTRGMMAGPGAAVAFTATPKGIEPLLYGRTVPGGAPRGISGTGYISLLAVLRCLGVLTASGAFAREAASPLAARVLSGLDDLAGEPCLRVCGLELPARDVEAMLKVKAAFNAAVRLLLESAGLAFPALSAVCLAGALGEHAHPADLETLGFLPPGAGAKTRAVGNTSLAGACLLAARPDVREWLEQLRTKIRPVDVALQPGFQEIFIQAMRFDHV